MKEALPEDLRERLIQLYVDPDDVVEWAWLNDRYYVRLAPRVDVVDVKIVAVME